MKRFNFATIVSILGFQGLQVSSIQPPGTMSLRIDVQKNERYAVSTLTSRGVNYYTNLLLGSDKQEVSVIIDTGSSDLWVVSKNVSCGSVNCTTGGTFDQSTSFTFECLNESFLIGYSDRTTAQGTYVSDDIEIPGGADANVQFGLVDKEDSGWGVLGLGKVSDEETKTKYPNFPVALRQQGQISKAAYSLYLSPNSATGSLIFGGRDTEKYTGELVYKPITDKKKFTIKLDGIQLSNGTNVELDNTTVLLDSGTSFSYLPPALLSDIAEDLGGEYSFGDYLINCSFPDKFLSFKFSDVLVKVPYSEFVQENYDSFGFPEGNCILNIFPGNLLGDSFLRHAYVVYDLEDNQIGIAPIKETNASNIIPF